MANSKTTARKANSHSAGQVSYRIFHDLLAVVETLARRRKSIGADALHSVAQSTRHYAAALTDLPNLRAQANAASESMDGLADYALHTNVENMVVDAAAMARKHPLATIGATVALGLFAALILRPTAEAEVATKQPRKPIAKKKSKAAPRVRINGKAKSNSTQKHA